MTLPDSDIVENSEDDSKQLSPSSQEKESDLTAFSLDEVFSYEKVTPSFKCAPPIYIKWNKDRKKLQIISNFKLIDKPN